jgi:D-alanine-D-alanine ligase
VALVTDSPTRSIAVLSGGLSLEREVSLRSGGRVADALTDRGHQVTRSTSTTSWCRTLEQGGFDVAYLALHGSAGEDGTIQSLLELIGLPYTGPDVLASSIAWNKPIAQGLYARQGLARAGARHAEPAGLPRDGRQRRGRPDREALGLPLVVKPATGGSSLGLTIVEDPTVLPQAIVGAFSYADVVLIERFVAGTEVAVTVLDGTALPRSRSSRRRAPTTSPPATPPAPPSSTCRPGSTRTSDGPASRRRDGLRRDRRPAPVAGRPDRGRRWPPWLLELDTCPGMTSTSLVPLAAARPGSSSRPVRAARRARAA